MRYQLKKTLIIKEGCLTITVPKGFKTDGASIPRLFWFVGWRPFDGDTLQASIVHDYLYKTDFCRHFCDQVFLQIMKRDGVGFIKRTTYYTVVRLLGWVSRLITRSML